MTIVGNIFYMQLKNYKKIIQMYFQYKKENWYKFTEGKYLQFINYFEEEHKNNIKDDFSIVNFDQEK